MGAVGTAAVAAAVWLTAAGLAGPAGVQAATQTEIVAIEEAMYMSRSIGFWKRKKRTL